MCNDKNDSHCPAIIGYAALIKISAYVSTSVSARLFGKRFAVGALSNELIAEGIEMSPERLVVLVTALLCRKSCCGNKVRLIRPPHGTGEFMRKLSLRIILLAVCPTQNFRSLNAHPFTILYMATLSANGD